jgi:hypothetical protein
MLHVPWSRAVQPHAAPDAAASLAQAIMKKYTNLARRVVRAPLVQTQTGV